MSYTKISNAIYNRLNGMSIISTLSQYEIQNPRKFPYISVVEDDTNDDEIVFDTVSNIVRYNFKIRIVDNAGDIEKTTTRMRKNVDKILEKLRKDLTFDCLVTRTNIGVKWGWMNEENNRVAEILLNMEKLEDIL